MGSKTPQPAPKGDQPMTPPPPPPVIHPKRCRCIYCCPEPTFTMDGVKRPPLKPLEVWPDDREESR